MYILESNAGLYVIWILLGALALGLIVFLLRKFIPGLKGEDVEEDEQKVAEDNVKRKIVEYKEEEQEKDEE